MDSHNILPLLGLALRGGNLAVGEEPVEAAARAKDARVLLLASDAPENTRRRVEHFAEAGQCLWLRLPFPKADLGRALGRTAVEGAAGAGTRPAHAPAAPANAQGRGAPQNAPASPTNPTSPPS